MRLLQRLSSLSLMQALLLAFAVKLVIASLLPVTGDEAYFVLWGRHLDFGYYDHPPMAGWMTWLQLQLSDHPVWVRMPGIFTELLIALWLHGLFRRHDADKARLLALLFLFSPLSLIFAFTLTDTGCMLFAAASFVAAARAVQSEQGRAAAGWAVLAGAGLGLAFLSKYFAVFLGLAYLIHFLVLRPAQWRLGLVVVLTALPFGLLNLYWNYTHCWSNVLFNLVNRNADGRFDALLVLGYVAMMAYVVLPWIWLALWRGRHQRDPVVADVLALARVVVVTAAAGFLLVSTSKAIGLHWVLWFYPMVLVLLWPQGVSVWRHLLRLTVAVSLLHVVVLLTVLLLPVSAWDGKPKIQRDLVSATEAPEILAQAEAVSGRLPLAMLGYSAASLLAYQVDRPVMVIGQGSKYARQDDSWTDFRALDGRDILVAIRRDREADDLVPWFSRIERFSISHRGLDFEFVIGRGFNYARYHAEVLVPVRERFYQFPDWLPQGQCEFTTRYF